MRGRHEKARQEEENSVCDALLVDLDYLAEQREGLAGVEVSEADLLILVAREVLLWVPLAGGDHDHRTHPHPGAVDDVAGAHDCPPRLNTASAEKAEAVDK